MIHTNMHINGNIGLRHLSLSDNEFYALASGNSPLRFERSPNGIILIISPSNTYHSFIITRVLTQIINWVDSNGGGEAGESSSGFILPSGATYAPDLFWISEEGLLGFDKTTAGFWRGCPTFVAEVKSPADNLAELREKMQHYIDNGCKLGWLFDVAQQHVYIYRPGLAETLHEGYDSKVEAGPEMPGFVLDLHPLLKYSKLLSK